MKDISLAGLVFSFLAQIGVGSGIKCGVNVWVALRDIQDEVHDAWEHRVPPGSKQLKRDGTWRRLAPQQVRTHMCARGELEEHVSGTPAGCAKTSLPNQ